MMSKKLEGVSIVSLPYEHCLIPHAKELRRTMTAQERKLWYEFLVNFEYRFQRQKAIGGYIADFFCARAKLVVEVDGAHHSNPENIGYDRARTEESEGLGIAVIRVPNADIECRFREACRLIEAQTRARIR